jgi:hypothetical protein
MIQLAADNAEVRCSLLPGRGKPNCTRLKRLKASTPNRTFTFLLLRYCTTMIEPCQKAARWLAGSSTLTWHWY